jgi:hypothetical protein
MMRISAKLLVDMVKAIAVGCPCKASSEAEELLIKLDIIKLLNVESLCLTSSVKSEKLSTTHIRIRISYYRPKALGGG